VTAGGLTGSYVLDLAKAEGRPTRPPGARDEEHFLATCTKCGQCVEACPFGTLKLATVGDDVPNGTPFFTPRDVPCEMCDDAPCARVCPSGSLDQDVNIREARMGLAVLLDRENCLAFKGVRCEACYRACPAIGDAITLDFQPQKGGEHACFLPVVHSDPCTGCGKCERACVMEEPAIRVLPRALALGVASDHYTFGLADPAAISSDFVAPTTTPVPAWQTDKVVLDSMNDLSGFEDE
jgi:ferredoxin-type protein NapG